MACCASESVEDGCVEFFIFPPISFEKDVKTTKTKLEEVLDLYTIHLSKYLFTYIWQNESFQLSPVADDSSSTPPHLYGCTNYGDNVEDEWFIVFLLVQLTKAFQDVVVRVCDHDGEFLLIEAADYLKKWMTPEACERRVYIYKGDIHIIPKSKCLGKFVSLLSDTPTLFDATTAIREFQSTTKSDKQIQQAVERRLSSFPDSIRENHHRAHCFLPASAVTILHFQPALLSTAVQTFYARDPVDLKACSAMKYFPPETRVLTEVTFTKCLYAQLMQQRFVPDKRVGWNLPSENNANYKAHELGMKLACGFEILAAQSGRSNAFNGNNKDFDNDVRWNRYVHSLKDKGYFKGNLEHSKAYNELLKKAKLYYMANVHRHDDDTGQKQLPGDEVLFLLNTLEVDMEKLKCMEKDLSPPDDDSWLSMTPEQLDGILSEKFSDGDFVKNNGHVEDIVADAVPSKLKSFVNHVSSHEGAELPKMRNKKSASNKSNRVTFDPDSFTDVMQSILDFKLPDWDDGTSSSSGMSDYSDDDGDELDLSKPIKKNYDSNNFVDEMSLYMDQMDRELARTTVGESFEKTEAVEDDVEDYHPVDIDLTALKNILESYSAQQGLPGPASNLLGSMGVELPQDSDK